MRLPFRRCVVISRHISEMYYPERYYRGLSQTKKRERAREIKRFGSMTSPAAYVGFRTDRGVTTRPSRYSRAWEKRFPGVKSLSDRAKKTGVPVRFLQESYDRGMAAWRTGHRPGATQQQWGYARVSSLLLCGKTYHTADADIVRRAIATSPTAKLWFSACKRV